MSFTYKSQYGSYPNCDFQISRYVSNNNLAISILSNEEGPITNITVNTGDRLTDDLIAIKNYSENEGMVDFLVSLGVIHPEPVEVVHSGYVEIPVHSLTDKGKRMILGDED